MTQQINLYDARLRPSRELATARNLAICTAALLALMVMLSVYVRHEASSKSAIQAGLQAEVRGEQERLLALSKANAERRVSPDLASELANPRALLASRQAVMDVLDSGKPGNLSGFSEIMFGFARQAQSDVWLTGFSISSGGEEIEIRGRMLDPAKLPSYVQRLSGEPVFHGRRFSALDMRSVDPEAPRSDPGAAGGAVVPAASAPPIAAMPRFVEFVLRSANVVVAPEGARQ